MIFERIYFVRGEFIWPRLSRKLKAQFQLDEFFRYEDYVSLRFFIYTDYAGAHAGWWTKTRNFFGAGAGRLEITDLFGMSGKALRYLTEYVVQDLRRQGGEDLSTPADTPLKELLEAAHSRDKWYEKERLWKLYSQYNFDQEKITFNFSPATIYGWAAGDRTVRVPWDGLIDCLNRRFKEDLVDTFLSRCK
jgi:hypothetical protein